MKKNKDREEEIKKMRRKLKEEIKGEAKCKIEGKPTLLNVLDILAKACPHMLDVDDIREMLGKEDQDTIKSWLSCLNKKVEDETKEKVLKEVNSWLRNRRMGKDAKILGILCLISMFFVGVFIYSSPLVYLSAFNLTASFIVWGITACYAIILIRCYRW